ncbi:MAG: DUF3108 domain-containing protein [Hymenobacteraceae bacterium]|nr:DUF3108 domain-containing protein [Hymenobacteraceae bacterium]
MGALLTFGAGLLALMPAPTHEAPRTVRNGSFGRGELLKYRIHYGIINAADGEIETANDLHRVNERPCFKVNVSGRTTGSFDFFLRIRDSWRSYIDTAAILPQKFVQEIAESKYRKRETMDFNHTTNTVTVENSREKEKKKQTFQTPDNVQDLVSGIFFIRTLDYTGRKVGEQIKIKGFFDNEVFDMTVTYRGRETIETKAGTFRCIKLTPKMPENKLFKGEDAIAVYLSDDENKIPVLVQAEMFVGSVKLDLYEYRGLRGRINRIAD